MTRYRNRGAWAANGGQPIYLGYKQGPVFHYSYYAPWREECYDDLHPGPPFRSGGPLTLTKSEYWHQPTDQLSLVGLLGAGYQGKIITNKWGSNPLGGNPPPFLDPGIYLPNHGSDGAKAWNRFRPAKPGVGLDQTLAELHHLPTIPRIKRLKAAADSAVHAGREYLNVEFGWKPLLNDLKKTVDTVDKVQNRLKQLRADNGHWIRRRGTLEDSVTLSVVNETESGYPIMVNQLFQNTSNPGTREVTTSIRRRRSFSGAFRYWIPELIDVPNNWAILKRVYGLNPSPATVWELTPWSWFVDWFTNVGDVIANASAMAGDNLVARYAYNMSSYELRETVRGTLYLRTRVGGAWRSVNARVYGYKRQTIKLRTAANPFGFGIDFGGLDFRQLAILGALGVSRIPNKSPF